MNSSRKSPGSAWPFANIVLAAIKLFAGIYGDSQAVVADGVEALLDVFTVIIVYAASRFLDAASG